MALNNRYNLGTILAIAIPLGVVALASILAAVVLGWRMSCVSARQARERSAWDSAQSSDYRRRSANGRSSLYATSNANANANANGNGNALGVSSGDSAVREKSKSDSLSRFAIASRPPGSPPKSTPPRRPSPLSPPPSLARRIDTQNSSLTPSPPLALGRDWSPASLHTPPKLTAFSGNDSSGRSDGTTGTIFRDALEPLSPIGPLSPLGPLTPPSPAAAAGNSTSSSSSTAKTERLLRLVQDEMIQEGQVTAPRFKKGHTSIASLSGSLVSSGGTGANSGTGSATDTPLRQARGPRLNDVSEQDDSASFGMSRLTDMRSSLELLGNRISVASTPSRSSSLASSYGTAQPLLQPPLVANGDSHSHTSHTKSKGGSSIRFISGLQSPRLDGGTDSAAASMRRKLRRNSTDAYASSKLNKPLPAPPVMQLRPQAQDGIVADLGGAVFRVIIRYTPQLSDELALNVGDQVKVFQLFDDGWCLGRKTVRGDEVQGICPESCLLRM